MICDLQILVKMWDFKDLRTDYRARNWTDAHFLTKPMDPRYAVSAVVSNLGFSMLSLAVTKHMPPERQMLHNDHMLNDDH